MKNKKRTMILVIIALIAVVGILVGTTYAYFTASVTNATAVNENVITTGTMALEFTDGPEVKLENAAPGSQVEKTFKVKNIGTVSTKYDVYFSELINTFMDKTDLVYTLESSDGGYNTTSEVQVPDSPSKMVDQQSIGVNETHNYTLTIKFKETNDNQNDNANKKFSSKIDINKYSKVKMAMFPDGSTMNLLMKSLAKGSPVTSVFLSSDSTIKAFKRSETLDNIDNEISVEGGPIYLWYSEDDQSINWYSDAETIYLNPDSSHLFDSIRNFDNLDLSSIDSSRVTNMSYMFYYCYYLKSLDLSGFDTSNVTDMGAMFSNTPLLTELNISSFNTSKVTNMAYTSGDGGTEYGMFNENGVTELDLSNFDTSNVTNMAGLFRNMKNLNNIIFGENFDTSNVTNMGQMFSSDSKITSLDLSGFDTSKVTNMRSMFSGMSGLTSFNLGNNFNTSNVTNMSSMFNGFPLSNIDLSNFNTSKVTNMSSMFRYMKNIENITFGENFDTSNVTDMSAMFEMISNLTTLDLSGFNTSNVTNMRNMFNESSMSSIIFSNNFKTSLVERMDYMFAGMKNIVSLDLSSFDTSSLIRTTSMFDGSTALETIYVSDKWNTDNVTNSSYMFYNNNNLKGGAGTAYNKSYKDKTYARVDDPDNGKPGYLTLKS